jgi:hypothetical protein
VKKLSFFWIIEVGLLPILALNAIAMEPGANFLEGGGKIANIRIDKAARVPISKEIYGVNNSWREINQDEFSTFTSSLKKFTNFSLMRFPGGWEAEHYDWSTNRTPNWKKSPSIPGASADIVLSRAPTTSFVLPTGDAMTGRVPISDFVGLATGLVKKYGSRVQNWEIGNEWWLQSGAKRSLDIRREMLRKYSDIVAQLAPAIKSADNHVVVYATMDWTHPEEVSTLRNAVGASAWDFVDGISVHPYCGDKHDERDCSSIGRVGEEIKSLSGKNELYASEWAPTRRYTDDKEGLPEANLLVVAFREMVRAGFAAAAYWPAARSVPKIALLSNDLTQPTGPGMLFGELANRYRGDALKTDGDLPAISAIGEDGTLRIIIPTMSPEPVTVHVKLPDGNWTKIMQSEVLTSSEESGANIKTQHVDVELSPDLLTVALNQGGGQWQIGIFTLGGQ